MTLKFIEGYPALLINSNILIISDLHLGKINIRDHKVINDVFEDELTKIKYLLENYSVRTLIINGDVKEALGRPSKIIVKQINEMLDLILSYADKIIIIQGNHDGRIIELLNKKVLMNQQLEVKKLEYVSLNNLRLLITHGHNKLSCEHLKETNIVISAHIHPALSLLDSSPLKVKIWGIFDILINCKDVRQLKWILMPAFASYISGLSLSSISNSMLLELSPFPKKESKIFKRNYFLLDLTPIENGD